MPFVLTRRSGEAVVIDGLTVTVEIIGGNKIRMIFLDPPGCSTPPRIHRREVLDEVPELQAVHGMTESEPDRPQAAESACHVSPKRSA